MVEQKQYQLTQEDIDILTVYKNNPSYVIEYSYGLLKGISEGRIDVPNPLSPFSYLLENAAVQASVIHDSHEATYREQYPKLATEYKHLYNHMFDEHYIGRFSFPAKATFEINFKYQEILKQLQLSERDGVRKIIIPRGSFITCQDYIFTILYPIVITQLRHGAIQILYDVEREDPIQKISSNIVDWDIVNLEEELHLRLKITLYNLRITMINDSPMQTGIGYRKIHDFKDKYVHLLAYQYNNVNEIAPIYTTHSDHIYDATKLTAKLQYLENRIGVEIPSVYSNNGLLNNRLYFEIYSSVGKVDDPIHEYAPDSFGYQWGRLETNLEDAYYTQALEELSAPIIYATSMLTGGADPETFEETRERVINFANYTKQPITYNQLKNVLRKNGYDIIKSIDNLTQRVYLASKPLSSDKGRNFTSGAASSIERIKVSIEDLVMATENVKDNGLRVSILPNTLFEMNDETGEVSIVSDYNIPTVEKLGEDTYLDRINSLDYMYTPFLYVLDTTKDEFEIRPYYLNEPEITEQRFIENNETSGYNISTDNYQLFKYKDEVKINGKKVKQEGYKIRIHVRYSEGYEELPLDKLFTQLLIRPYNENNFAYVNGVLLGSLKDEDAEALDYFWEFTLPTNWDVTADNNIVLHNLYMYINEPRKFEFPLTGEFYIIHGVLDQDISGYRRGAIDKLINTGILDDDFNTIGVSMERFNYHLGDNLDRLWSNAFAVNDGNTYELYEYDVPRVYLHDVYDVSADGEFIIENDELKLLHRAGDPVMINAIDEDTGEPIIDPKTQKPKLVQAMMARKGDVKIDRFGNPIISKDRTLKRFIDLYMVDGIYWFATDVNDIKYRDNIAKEVYLNVKNDLDSIALSLLENTRIYYYPKQTMGVSKIVIDEGRNAIKVPLRASFNVVYYLDDFNFRDTAIRQSLMNKTHEIINQQLTLQTVSNSNIIAELEKMAGESIIAVTLDRFKESIYDFNTYTIQDATIRRSVKRKLELTDDNYYQVVEDINITFLKHGIVDEIKGIL